MPVLEGDGAGDELLAPLEPGAGAELEEPPAELLPPAGVDEEPADGDELWDAEEPDEPAELGEGAADDEDELPAADPEVEVGRGVVMAPETVKKGEGLLSVTSIKCT